MAISESLSITKILEKKAAATLQIETLGSFEVTLNGQQIPDSAWKRDAAIQLFQYFITSRNSRALHKASIIDRIWGETEEKAGNRNFKAALHQLTKTIEPDKTNREDHPFIIRQGLTYRLDTEQVWMDIDALDDLIIIGNQTVNDQPEEALLAYRQAVDLYRGIYLPNRIYEDWCADERERIQVLVLGAMMSLAKLQLSRNSNETIRLAVRALQIDPTWEEAYRLQMEAYLAEGNRPLAVKTYRKCQQILMQEFEIEPLPETRRVFEKIVEAG